MFKFMYIMRIFRRVHTTPLPANCGTKVLDHSDGRYKEEVKREGKGEGEEVTQKPVDSAEIGDVPFREGQSANDDPSASGTGHEQHPPSLLWRKTMRPSRFPLVKRTWHGRK